MISVLDHGFVRLRNLSGPTRRHFTDGPTIYNADEASERIRPFDADDVDPANSARMSFEQMDSGRTREADLKLAKYLLRNRHTTPIEMIECWIEMKLPIFVARQFVRHRTVSINEVSARYVKLPAEWYIPKPENVGIKLENVKQGRLLQPGDVMPNARWFCDALNQHCQLSYKQYEFALSREIPPEIARCFLHVNHYTHWLWKQDLWNMMHFLCLRLDPHAQFEARAYAQAIYDLLSAHLPALMSTFREIFLGGEEHGAPSNT